MAFPQGLSTIYVHISPDLSVWYGYGDTRALIRLNSLEELLSVSSFGSFSFCMLGSQQNAEAISRVVEESEMWKGSLFLASPWLIRKNPHRLGPGRVIAEMSQLDEWSAYLGGWRSYEPYDRQVYRRLSRRTTKVAEKNLQTIAIFESLFFQDRVTELQDLIDLLIDPRWHILASDAGVDRSAYFHRLMSYMGLGLKPAGKGSFGARFRLVERIFSGLRSDIRYRIYADVEKRSSKGLLSSQLRSVLALQRFLEVFMGVWMSVVVGNPEWVCPENYFPEPAAESISQAVKIKTARTRG